VKNINFVPRAQETKEKKKKKYRNIFCPPRAQKNQKERKKNVKNIIFTTTQVCSDNGL